MNSNNGDQAESYSGNVSVRLTYQNTNTMCQNTGKNRFLIIIIIVYVLSFKILDSSIAVLLLKVYSLHLKQIFKSLSFNLGNIIELLWSVFYHTLDKYLLIPHYCL